MLAVELSGPERFCVYIDHHAGVDHALCEQVTGLLRGYLARYSVDVSSPGFERPLRTRRISPPPQEAGSPSERHRDRRAQPLPRHSSASGRRTRSTIELDEHEVEIPYDAIVRANLIDEGR